MKKTIALLFIVTSLLFAEVRDLNISSFEKMEKNGIPVIDIRTPREWRESGIIAGSHTIMFFGPDGRYDVKSFIADLEKLGIRKKTPFILVCRSANRTRKLGDYLSEELGYENVYHLTGGILNWKRHEKPLIPYKP